MMWEPTVCCFCFSRRTGSLILGTIIVVAASLNILGILRAFLSTDFDQIIREVCAEEEDFENCDEITKKVVIGTVVISFIVSLIKLSFGSILIYGIMKSKTRMLIPFMIMYLIEIIIIMLVILFLMGLVAVFKIWWVFFVVTFFGGLYIFIETYFLLVIRAYYLEVRRDKAQVHMVLQEEGFNPVYPIPQEKLNPYLALYPTQNSSDPYFYQEKSN